MGSEVKAMTVREHLILLNACPEAMSWLGDRTAKQAWEECEHPDWLLWWAGRTPANDKVAIVRVACAIARTVLHLVPSGEDRPRLAIEAAEAWCADPSDEKRDAAAYAAAAYAAAAYAAYAAYAADAAAYAAAYAADAAAYAAAYAADAAAYAAAAYAARTKARSEYCVLIRQHLVQPWEDAGPTVPPREVVNSARILVTAIKQAELDGHKIPNTVADACNWLDAALPSPGASDREAGR